MKSDSLLENKWNNFLVIWHFFMHLIICPPNDNVPLFIKVV